MEDIILYKDIPTFVEDIEYKIPTFIIKNNKKHKEIKNLYQVVSQSSTK